MFEKHLIELLDQYGSLWIVLGFIAISAIGHLAINILLNFFHKKSRDSLNHWDDALFDAVGPPVKWGWWLFNVYLAIVLFNLWLHWVDLQIFTPFRGVILIFFMSWFLLRWTQRASNIFMDKAKSPDNALDTDTVKILARLTRFIILIIAGLLIAQTLGASVSGALAFGGAGGIALGFAAKDLLANFFGGVIVYFDKPFREGDWVRSPDRDIEGTVEHIGWRVTRIRRFDKRPLYVPNSVFSNILVENPSRMTHRRINETIGIRYNDLAAMPAIVRDVKAMLIAHPEIDETQTMIVNFNAFNASSCDFFIYTFTHTTEWIKFHAVKQDVLLKVADIIAQQGGEIAYPTSTLHLASVPEHSGMMTPPVK